MYISEKINNEYKNWDGGDYVFISSQTGTGKTYFILKILLPYEAEEKGKKILYLVNRKILKEQLTQYVKNDFRLPRKNIKIETYQYVEKLLLEQNNNKLVELSQYDIVVCDEAHYFLADSTYNTYTELSFNWIKETFKYKLNIFLSATISQIKPLFAPENVNGKSESYSVNIRCNEISTYQNSAPSIEYISGMVSAADITKRAIGINAELNYFTRNYYFYDMKKDNSFFVVSPIKNRKECVSLVMSDRENKWLIFVDSLKFGKELKRDLIKEKNKILKEATDTKEKEKIEKIEVKLLSAGYHDLAEKAKEKEAIEKDEMQRANVLIATSVMDNGISLKDIKLKNVIIIADTEVEFIQMLGRKRREIDEDNVNLHIFRYGQAHFVNRKDYYSNLYNIVLDIEEKKEMYNAQIFHNWLLKSIFEGNIDFDIARKILYVKQGNLYISELAKKHIYNLLEYYDSICKLFEKDGEDAFIKEQLRWLGCSEEDIEEKILEWQLNEEEKAIKTINDTIGKLVNIPINSERNGRIKEELCDEFLVLINSITDEQLEDLSYDGKMKMTKESLVNWIKGHLGDHFITYKQMNVFSQIYNIPYTIKKTRNKDEYIFIEKRDEIDCEPTS